MREVGELLERNLVNSVVYLWTKARNAKALERPPAAAGLPSRSERTI